ncbi:hypothetical protein [Achromobacter xylosoxidans]|uniref:Uncharacterized protein n=1 Tax=Alcaligenes xylosoxydans xylosoxydans TaxID=85698 RepID=A0A424W5C2_ALCXX|nr:hypothetical protein [Achromobacter xylosoxidans]MBC9904803.1 hypothetical protein [Achromobacter xylosoxidans]MBD0868720.1 hypothetical protein [Achromobacter xylosoxidans]QNP87778.1 hypothetical protein IAG39_09825 [Achromobacter xylosoxidans]RPJ88445.1 hypothetical protein DY367_27960 [Achromobacter xylosoxidans]
MQSDLELLELAAQAIGEQFHSGHITQNGKQYEWVEWNPLTDDGDALRLAVKLSQRPGGIAILLNSRFDSSMFATVYTDEHHLAGQEYMGDNAGEATRRAIVRAAAEIGAQAHPKQHNDGGAVYG